MPVTVRQAARELGLAVRTVQQDVAAGCPGIVRPGAPGRGRGTLLDLEAYRAYRFPAADLEADRERAWGLLCEGALQILKSHGGVTRQTRQRSAELMVRLLTRVYPALTGRDLEDPPEQMREILRVLQD